MMFHKCNMHEITKHKGGKVKEVYDGKEFLFHLK